MQRGSVCGREARRGRGVRIRLFGSVTRAAIYKQLTARYGDFAHSVILASTAAIKSADTTYLPIEQQIQQLTAQRDALAQQMKDVLDGSAVGHREQLTRRGRTLLAAAAALAND